MTLLNFNATIIIGGTYKLPPANDAYKLRCIIADYLFKLYLESHDCIKDLISSTLSLSENNTKILNETQLDVNFLHRNIHDL